MQSLWLPQEVCNKINQASRTMLWAKVGSSRCWSLVGWNIVTRPKELGGLGIRESRQVNVSLIGKLIWDLIHSPHKPWVKFLQAKYLHRESVLHAKKSNSSLWYEDWLGLGLICREVPYVHISDTDILVAQCWQQGVWNFDSLYTRLPMELANRIQQVQIPSSSIGANIFSWVGDSSECYTTASSFRFLLPSDHRFTDPIWKRVWKLHILEKVKFLLWQGLHSSLPTNHFRYIRHLDSMEGCPRCSCPQETILHAIRDCPHSKEVWLLVGNIPSQVFSMMDCFTWFKEIIINPAAKKLAIIIWWI
uniref:Ribonuclease H protein At1g65750 family n=1 Tax=Cajanus cajan TaxID=3821 RepID=A0A151RY57_CAJCA|nr:Putative ribonuclease H protein At1g65750 family [Cajanus cajan]